MKKLLQSLFILLFVATTAMAQDRTITGTVTSKEDGLPLPGVSVKVKGSNAGTSTAANGRFSLVVKGNVSALEFSSLGYLSQTVNVGSSNSVNVSLVADSKALTEVIVTGYGVQQKREVTGSISQIKGDAFQDQPIQSFDKALQGRAAGVQVNSTSGQPGGGISVNIRGTATINGSTQPLYIVDGVQMNSGGVSGQTSVNTLASINPNDIESIEILKDAASAAIYGSLAGNGVVLITTKKGKAGKSVIRASAQIGNAKQYNPYDILDAATWYKLRVEAFENQYVRAGFSAAEGAAAAAAATFPAGVPAVIENYNWIDAVSQTGKNSQYDLSVSGGDAKTKFFISGSFNNNDGTILSSNYKRGTFRANLDHTISDKFTVSASLSLAGSKAIGPGTTAGFFTNTPFTGALLTAPINKVYNADGTFNTNFIGTNSQNSVQNLVQEIRKAGTFQTVSNLALTYKIMPGLSAKVFGGIDFSDVNDLNYRPATLSAAAGTVGSGAEQFRRNINYTTTGTVNYAKTIGDHNLSALAGVEFREVTGTVLSGTAQGFASPVISLLSGASTPTATTSSFTGYRTAGILGNVKYDYKGRYLFSGNVRYDGSSRFGANKRFGLFYGVSGGWRVIDEDFMKDQKVMSDLKLRASYGETGVQPTDNFGVLALYGNGGQYGNPGLSGGLRPIQLPNPDLTWEVSKQVNFGLDLGFLKNRITLSFDIYRKTNSDLILGRTLPGDSGFGSINENAGKARTEGIDIDLNTRNVETKDLRWTTNFNIAFNRNKLLQLNNGLTNISDFFYTVGMPLYQIFTYKYAGVNPADGRAMYYDKNQNITYNPTLADRQYIGDQNPDFFGGFTNTISYKGITLDFMFQYQYGNYSYIQSAQYIEQSGSIANNQLVSQLQRWTTPGQLTAVPRPFQGQVEPGSLSMITFSSRFVERASYIRLKQANLSYRIPEKITQKIRIPNVTVSLQGLNLLTFTNYRGDDPENSGNNLNFYPNPRVISGGLSVQF
ncbi:TonB-dependent receptor [Pedobacter sp. ASV28]|uniref:SusC/RagA family TonB-linked outer membrane protein n=1 Tax=Pedobacter sp. ASV28 TaxID=2795123 RepID=UPI0018EBCF09|nr:TonB-dependent receptor [Pedobacter sp. ASV28]